MADRTTRFGLTTLNRDGETFAFEGYRFGVDDRRTLDRLLQHVVEAHRHDASVTDASQTTAPTLSLGASGTGRIPAGTDALYRFALVDNRGQEMAASPIAAISVPGQLRSPRPPVLTNSGAGTLLPGLYDYALSVFTGSNKYESQVGPTASLVVTAASGITLTLPSLDNGADGFNIYRRSPLEPDWVYLDSTTVGEATYTDDGTVSTSPIRGLPKRNATQTRRSVTITLPAALPSGYTWRCYRTFDRTNWANSLLDWSADTSIVDYGTATRAGQPLASTLQLAGAPIPIMDDASEFSGALPPGLMVVPHEVNINLEGDVEAGYSQYCWVSEFDQADILFARATLGIGSSPADVPVTAVLERMAVGTGTWETLTYTFMDIPVGEQQGDIVDCSVGADYYHLNQGDALRVLVVDEGGGATPTDANLTVSILLLVSAGSTTTSHVWSDT